MRGLLGAVLAAGLAATAAGQDAVTYKAYAFKKGDKTRTTRVDDATSTTTVLVNEMVQKKNEVKKKTVAYVTEVLEVGPDATKPARLKRTYERAVEEVDGKETKMSLDGLVVIAEKKGEKYAFTLAGGGAPDAKALAELDKSLNKKGSAEEDFFPKGAVKPGDSWDLTEKLLKEAVDEATQFGFDKEKSKATAKLLATSRKGGMLFGDLSVTADLPMTELRGKQPIKLNPGSRMSLEMTGSGVLDGSSPEGGMTGRTRLKIDGALMGVALKIEADIKQTTKTERVK
jgi:hypothetical protein